MWATHTRTGHRAPRSHVRHARLWWEDERRHGAERIDIPPLAKGPVELDEGTRSSLRRIRK